MPSLSALSPSGKNGVTIGRTLCKQGMVLLVVERTNAHTSLKQEAMPTGLQKQTKTTYKAYFHI